MPSPASWRDTASEKPSQSSKSWTQPAEFHAYLSTALLKMRLSKQATLKSSILLITHTSGTTQKACATAIAANSSVDVTALSAVVNVSVDVATCSTIAVSEDCEAGIVLCTRAALFWIVLHVDIIRTDNTALFCLEWVRTGWLIYSVSTTSSIRIALTNRELPILRWRWCGGVVSRGASRVPIAENYAEPAGYPGGQSAALHCCAYSTAA